jgi:hypothetical protein
MPGHTELTDFYFGKQYIYATKMVQFNEVYVPMFPSDEPESGSNLKFVLWIRNDRNSNQPLLQGQEDLDRFVRDFNQHPGSVTGILRQPINRVRNLTLKSYPGTNRESLQVLWARDFPSEDSTDLMWALCVGSLLMAAACAYAYKRQSHSVRD